VNTCSEGRMQIILRHKQMTIQGIYNIGLCDSQRSVSLILSSIILCDYLHTCILEHKPFLTYHTQKSEIKPPV